MLFSNIVDGSKMARVETVGVMATTISTVATTSNYSVIGYDKQHFTKY